MDLSITNLETERQRRQIELIERLVRSGAELPTPKFYLGRQRGEASAEILFGTVTIYLEYVQVGIDPYTKKLVVELSKNEVERKLHALFSNEAVTKKLYDHIFTSLEKYMGEQDGKVEAYGETKFCG